jgi:hypothetical protein
MDEPSTLLGPSHRMHRHDPETTPREAKQLFGEMADQACLDHIRLDLQESGRGTSDRTLRKLPPQLGTYHLICPYCKNEFDIELSGEWSEICCSNCSKEFRSLLAKIKSKRSGGMRLITPTSETFVPFSASMFESGDVLVLSYKEYQEENEIPALVQDININTYVEPLKKKGCFIATVSCGFNSWEVCTLRKFRDAILLKSAIGKMMVSSYYIVSPRIAKAILYHETAKRAVKQFLVTPIARFLSALYRLTA